VARPWTRADILCRVSVDLTELGWDAQWAAAFAPHAAEGLVPARIAIEYNHIYRAVAAAGDIQVQLAGRLKHAAAGRHELPAVGDWAALRLTASGDTGTIEALLARRTRFSRKVAGETTEEQIVAANIDTVFLVMGLDGDFNPRRIERYLLVARDSGARAVVLLSKADLAADRDAAARAIESLAPGTPVHPISAREPGGVEIVYRYLGAGRTGALLGSSGVGKSTLINALVGEERFATKEVRDSDSRGRHATRHRQLILLPGRGLLIDTPGMRELQPWDVTDALEETFDDVEALAVSCHFTDCRHRGEPRCAVQAAVEEGALTEGRLANYHKLQDEMRSLEARKDARAIIDEKRRTRTTHKALKELHRDRGR
jgi:ribosome biogenesis GTPase / thiamine phosphate phosphatase